MAVPLLTTKFYIPPVRPESIARPRLSERLDSGLCRKLTLISAPAGFGKTALIAEWLRGRGRSQTCPHVAWLSLDEDDNDPARFFTYLVAALGAVQVEVGADARTSLQSPQSAPLKSALTILINRLAAVPADLVLVLDDYQVIEQPIVHDALSFLLDHLPPQMHLVIATRADPPLPLARLRTQGQLVELRAAELRFTVDEATAFFNDAMGLNLSVEDVAALELRTEGWIAGLQLAALSMRGKDAERVSDFIAAFSGSHRHVIDYLAEEVLAGQPDEMRDFMCQTAILERLTAPLCDAVTGREDSDALLRQLEQANLFLIPLDDRREWYRYHRLFADFLRQEVPDRVRDLHCWAAEWYEHNGFVAEAVGHALKARDDEWAARLIERTALTILAHGEVTRLLAWLEALPEERIHSQLELRVYLIWALIIAGELDRAEAHLQGVEQELGPNARATAGRELWGQIVAARAYLSTCQGDLARATRLARQAVDLLPSDKPFLRSVAMWLLGFVNYFVSDPAMADRAFEQARELGQATGSALVALLSTYASGFLQVVHGHLRQARQIFELGLRRAEADSELSDVEWNRRPSPALSLMYQGLGEIAREQNDLESAQRHLGKCIELAEGWGNAEVLVDSYVYLARVKQAQGDLSGARSAIERAERCVRDKPLAPLTVRQVEAYRARLWLAEGDLEAAARWAASWEGTYGCEEMDRGERVTLFVRAIEQLTLARLWIAQREFDGALSAIGSLLRTAEAGEWTWLVIEALACQASALYGQGKSSEALSALGRALSLAEPEGFVRVFADLGAPMEELLRHAHSRGVRPGYVGRLLAVYAPSESQISDSALAAGPVSDSKPQADVAGGWFLEPLSERELEVLRLVAEGLSNREIADGLTITIGTVKRHASNIYAKLDVHSRVQAAARARELGLL